MLLKAIVGRTIDHLGNGVFAVKFPDGTTRGDWAKAEVTIEIVKRRALWRTIFFGYVGFMESYFNGAINIGGTAPDPLSRLINITYENPLSNKNPILKIMQWAYEWRKDNSSFRRARKNAEAHYNLPAEFFRLFLGDAYGYTEGYFARGNAKWTAAAKTRRS